MAKVLEVRTDPTICSIPLHQAVIAKTAARSPIPGPIVVVFAAVKRFCGQNRSSTTLTLGASFLPGPVLSTPCSRLATYRSTDDLH
jgi:hypothetical protein